MPDCRRRRTIIGLVPLPFLRDALLAKHASGCARCGEDLADVREAKSVTWAGADFEGRTDFWPRFEAALKRPEPSARPRFAARWRWAAVAAAAAGMAAGLILLDFEIKQNGLDLPPGLKMAVESSFIYDQPAQAYIFQTREENATFVWLEQNPQGEQP